MCIDNVRRLRIAERKKCPEKQRTNTWILLHDNAPAHRSVLCEDFLTKKHMTTLDHPLTLLTWLQLILPVTSGLNQHRRDGAFFDAADIKNATEELKRLSQNGFQEWFQHLYCR